MRRRQTVQRAVPALPSPVPRQIDYRTRALTSRLYRLSLARAPATPWLEGVERGEEEGGKVCGGGGGCFEG